MFLCLLAACAFYTLNTIGFQPLCIACSVIYARLTLFSHSHGTRRRSRSPKPEPSFCCCCFSCYCCCCVLSGPEPVGRSDVAYLSSLWIPGAAAAPVPLQPLHTKTLRISVLAQAARTVASVGKGL